MSKKNDKNKVNNKVNNEEIKTPKTPMTDAEKEKMNKTELEALLAAKAVELRNNDKKFMEDKQKEQEKEEKNKKYRRWTKIGILIVLILLLLARCSALPVPEQVQNIINMGFENTIDKDDIEEKDPFADYDNREALLTISMNKVPIFENGQSKGNINIINDDRNVYNQYVEIYLDGPNGQPDMTKMIYRSGLIGIGQALEKDTLDVNLPAGTYNCTAYFNAVRTDTNAYAGKAGAKIEITIVGSKGDTVDVNSDWTVVEENSVE